MFDFIKDYLIKKVLIKGVIGQLEKVFASLPMDEAKTISGILIACLGLVLQSLPQTSPYVQPILDYLKLLPSTEIIAGGIGWTIVGFFHKILKLVVRTSGSQTALEKKEENGAKLLRR